VVLGALAIYMQEMKLDTDLSCTKINSKWIKGLHVRLETLELLQEKLGTMSA
jgi:hypothetical protein